MLVSEKIIAGMAGWTVLAFIAAYLIGPPLEVFMIIELIGLVIIRELLDIFTPFVLKKKMDMFIFLGLFIFALIVARRIMIVLEFI